MSIFPLTIGLAESSSFRFSVFLRLLSFFLYSNWLGELCADILLDEMRFKFPFGDFWASLISLAYSSTLSWICLLLSLTNVSLLSLAAMTFSIRSKSLKPFLCTISFKSICNSYSSVGSLLEFFFRAAKEIACKTSKKRFWMKLSKLVKVRAWEAPDGCEFKKMLESSFRLLIESI